jgi:hypothetical protein
MLFRLTAGQLVTTADLIQQIPIETEFFLHLSGFVNQTCQTQYKGRSKKEVTVPGAITWVVNITTFFFY